MQFLPFFPSYGDEVEVVMVVISTVQKNCIFCLFFFGLLWGWSLDKYTVGLVIWYFSGGKEMEILPLFVFVCLVEVAKHQDEDVAVAVVVQW